MSIYKSKSIHGCVSVDALLGLATADALGVPAEFMSRDELMEDPVTTMRGYGTYDVPAGSWSDDTSMTLAFMDAVIKAGWLDYEEIMRNFDAWISGAKYTPGGDVFDSGGTCVSSIRNYCMHLDADPIKAEESGMDGECSNGNGSLMRFVPVPLYCDAKGLSGDELVKAVDDSSSLTHRHDVSRLGCYIYTRYVMAILSGLDKYEAYEHVKGLDYSMYPERAVEKYGRVLEGDIAMVTEDDIRSSGYVVDSLEAALWCVLNTENYRDAAVTAINLGEDTDTVGAITGSVAGILYGSDSIPEEWLEFLARKGELEDLAKRYDNAIE